MDECDRAQTHIEMMAVENIRASKKPEGPQPTGYCLHCDEPVAEGHRWCDTECRDDWAKGGAEVKPRIWWTGYGWVCSDQTAFGTTRSGYGMSPKSAYERWCQACSE